MDPGEKYKIELGTKTGTETTRAPISEVIMTKPMAVKGIMVNDITPTAGVLHWLDLDGHPCLKGFQIIISTGDGKVSWIVVIRNLLSYHERPEKKLFLEAKKVIFV